MSRTAVLDRQAFWRKLIARAASSRLTVGKLCRRAGVSTASFYAWRRRLEAPSGGAPAVVPGTSSLLPVRIVADGNRSGGEITVEFADTTPHASMPLTAAVRVTIPPGCDEASIRLVLGAVLSARQAGRDGGRSC